MIEKPKINKNILFSADGAEFFIEESLRELPGKRKVCKGIWKKQSAVAKLFLDPRNARRHWAREKQGIEALQCAGVATPELLFCGVADEGTPVLVSSYLPDAETAMDIWAFSESEQKAVLLRQLAAMVGRMHEAGLVQEDLHLENFLVSADEIYAIDGDAVRIRYAGKPLALKPSSRNLSLLFAQFPPDHDDQIGNAALDYVKQRQIPCHQLLQRLKCDLPAVRRRRRHKYIKKCMRTCSEFVRSKMADRIAVYRRDLQGEVLTCLLNDPEAFMQRGESLKDGLTSTVVRVRSGGSDWVVKRYNIKGLRHAIRRSFRPTRAWTSWQNSHRLKISGIATPRAVAMIEKRFGPFRSTGYYVCEFVDAPHAQEVFQDAAVPVAEKELLAGKFVHLFGLFHKLKIHHGDCKATNFLFRDNQLWVVDLDAMRECLTTFGFARLFRIDRRRFLCNWEAQPELWQWFDEHLPGNIAIEGSLISEGNCKS